MKIPTRQPDFIDDEDWSFWFKEKVAQSGLTGKYFKTRFTNQIMEWESCNRGSWLSDNNQIVFNEYKKWLISKELKKRLK